MNQKCIYCGKSTPNVIELGRGVFLTEIPCCQNCFKEVDKFSQERKDEMSEAAFIKTTGTMHVNCVRPFKATLD